DHGEHAEAEQAKQCDASKDHGRGDGPFVAHAPGEDLRGNVDYSQRAGGDHVGPPVARDELSHQAPQFSRGLLGGPCGSPLSEWGGRRWRRLNWYRRRRKLNRRWGRRRCRRGRWWRGGGQAHALLAMRATDRLSGAAGRVLHGLLAVWAQDAV